MNALHEKFVDVGSTPSVQSIVTVLKAKSREEMIDIVTSCSDFVAIVTEGDDATPQHEMLNGFFNLGLRTCLSPVNSVYWFSVPLADDGGHLQVYSVGRVARSFIQKLACAVHGVKLTD